MDFFEIEGEPPRPTWAEVVARVLPHPLTVSALTRLAADLKARQRRWIEIVAAAVEAFKGEP